MKFRASVELYLKRMITNTSSVIPVMSGNLEYQYMTNVYNLQLLSESTKILIHQ